MSFARVFARGIVAVGFDSHSTTSNNMDVGLSLRTAKANRLFFQNTIQTCELTFSVLMFSDDIDMELRMARFEHLMDRRPLLLSRFVPRFTLTLSFLFLWGVGEGASNHIILLELSKTTLS